MEFVEDFASFLKLLADKLHSVIADENGRSTAMSLVVVDRFENADDSRHDDTLETLLVDRHLDSHMRKIFARVFFELWWFGRVELSVLLQEAERSEELEE